MLSSLYEAYMKSFYLWYSLIKLGSLKVDRASGATSWILNIAHYAEQTRTPSLLLSIDAEKVFDCVYWLCIV